MIKNGKRTVLKYMANRGKLVPVVQLQRNKNKDELDVDKKKVEDGKLKMMKWTTKERVPVDWLVAYVWEKRGLCQKRISPTKGRSSHVDSVRRKHNVEL